MTTEYRVGNKVWLVSGGPAMTIQKIEGREATCVWFDKYENFQERKFSLDVLTTENPRGVRATHI